MKKLVLVLFLAALAVPAVAQAKGALGVEMCGADGCKHSVAIVWRGTDMTAGKPVGGVESTHPRCD